jgi:hypothetical protein
MYGHAFLLWNGLKYINWVFFTRKNAEDFNKGTYEVVGPLPIEECQRLLAIYH